MTARTIGEDLRAAALAAPDRAAVIAGDRTITFADLDRAADGIAAGLLARGVGRGDRVGMLMPNGIDAASAIYGVFRAGGALLPLNPSLKAQKLGYLLRDCGASVLLCDQGRAEVAREAAARLERLEVVENLSELIAEGEPARPALSIDLAAVVYTSGSTGEPKGVTLTHGNMTFVADSIVEYLEMDESTRILNVLPLSFGYGLYQLLTSVRAGGTLVLEDGIAFPGRVVQLLEKEAITDLPGVPTIFQVLLSLRGLAEREFPALRLLTNAGAGLPAPTLTALRETFPRARLYPMYGQTECQRVCYLPPEQVDEKPGSVGIPIPGTEAWIEDEHGELAAPGVVGELMVRGAHVMQGYWGAPEATAARLRQGRWPWDRVLATGDLFRADEDGYLYFVSRRDDIIKSRGEKVAPKEVEDVLLTAGGVIEAAVVGVPDELLGQAVQAHVVAEPGHALDPAELRRHCALALEDHMVPSRIVVHEERLPRTGNAKIDRRTLAEL